MAQGRGRGGGARGQFVARPLAFWVGVLAVTTGVCLHIPMWLDAAKMHYRLVGMAMGLPMEIGMGLILLGLAATAYGLVPPKPGPKHNVDRISIRPMDDAKLSSVHVALLLVMTFAVIIDVMKPVALGFIAPGMAREYGMKSPVTPHGSVPVAYLPLFATIGTVLGSFLWGSLADRIGRRASILLAAVLFMATAICGAMPSYQWNFFMCFTMGLAAGGMLPIAFALISETMPSRHRSWLMVLTGAQFALAYILTSWLAQLLLPHYGWRILWLIQLPTGLLLVLLNRWIPESPRFLLAQGRSAEARAVMARYGARVVLGAGSDEAIEATVRSDWREIFSRRLLNSSLVIGVLALGAGLISFGFQLWLPSNLQKLGFNAAASSRILRNGALIGLPATFALAALYGLWSSRKTIVLLAVASVAALVGCAAAGNSIAHHQALMYLLLAVPITAGSSLTAVVLAYSAELYPTKVRSRGAGFAAAGSKTAGVVVSALVVTAVAAPSIAITALICAALLAVGVPLTALFGVETRTRRLEEITAAEYEPAGAV